jgi:hypothetical protein
MVLQVAFNASSGVQCFKWCVVLQMVLSASNGIWCFK